MEWKKVAESKELIILEKELKDYKIKIEARKIDDSSWEVFKTKVNGESSSLISEYNLDTEHQVKKVIEKLMKDDISKTQIRTPQKTNSLEISLKRIYKEEYIEKWFFFIGNDNIKNFLVAKFDNNITVDVVMHEKYRHYEKSILSYIEEKLGLKELGETISHDIYYFKKQGMAKSFNTRDNEYNFNFIDVDFGVDDEDI